MKILDVPQSGSVAGVTSSRNRNGQYRRSRATPTNPATAFQAAVRARIQSNSASWRTLTVEQRSGWNSLGQQMTRTDSLGQTYTLTGFQAYCSVNNNLLAAGDTAIADAPSLVTPDPVALGTITLTAAAHTIAYTPTPLGAGERLFVYASPQGSAGRAYESNLKLVHVSAAAAATPADIESSYNARCGTPVVGNRIHYALCRYIGGFLSAAVNGTAVVSA